MNHPILSSVLTVLMTVAAGAQAITINPTKPQAPEPDRLVHKVYTLQEQDMRTVNWMYVGEVPRVNDPSRIKVILSKQGFTLRVNFWMTPEEVIDYPNYLQRKAQRMKEVISIANNERPGHSLEIGQYHRVQKFFDLAETVGPMGVNFDQSFQILAGFFPKNIRKIPCPNDSRNICAEGNFVYPITTHETAMLALDGKRVTAPMTKAIPDATTYYTEILEERRSAYFEYYEEGPMKGYRTGKIKSHLFGGLPTFWFKTGAGTKGQGIHGPVRFSSVYDGGIVRNDYLNDPEGWQNIQPTMRAELVRTANSDGCVRLEPMEFRHLLPSNANLAKQVPIKVINEIDMIDEDLDGVGDYYVDVDYYVANHYREQDRRDWYLKHFITYEERQQAKLDGMTMDQVLDQKLQRTKTFPYLHPNAVEFTYKEPVPIDPAFGLDIDAITEITAAPATMGMLNRAPAK
jgi:hypothetical protein